MPTNPEVIDTIQTFCRDKVFDKRNEDNKYWDEYKRSWLNAADSEAGAQVREEKLSRFTLEKIQHEVQQKFGSNDITLEKGVGKESELKFDLWNKTQRTAFEICLSAIKNEFEKDVLKGILDQDTTAIIIFYREYRTGEANTIYGRKWFDHPAQREIIKTARIFKLQILPTLLVP